MLEPWSNDDNTPLLLEEQHRLEEEEELGPLIPAEPERYIKKYIKS